MFERVAAKVAPKKPVPKKPVPKKPAPKAAPKPAPKKPLPKAPAKPAPKKPLPKAPAKPVSRPLSKPERLALVLEKERREKEALRAQRKAKHLEQEELRRVRREAKHQANTTKANVKLEIDAVKIIKKTMQNRFSRAKLMAHSVSSRIPGVLKSYLEDNKDNAAEIGWLEQLNARIKQFDLDLVPVKKSQRVTAADLNMVVAKRALEFDPNSSSDELDLTPEEDVPGNDSAVDLAEETEDREIPAKIGKLSRLLDKAIVGSHSRAMPTKKFGANSDVAAFFNGRDAVAMGFSIGRPKFESTDASGLIKDRVGISLGSNFTYSTSHEAEDNEISSDYIKQKFFRKLNLVRFNADPRHVLSAETIQVLKRQNGTSNGQIKWLNPLELWGEANQNGRVGDVENGCAGGLYFGVYQFIPTSNFSSPITYLVLGFWGVVGMKLEELKVATYNAFDLSEQNTGDLATSCLGNLTISGDPMIEHRELSLRAPQNDPSLPSQLVKNSLGYFIAAQNIDRRHEFPDFDITGTLPKWLRDPDLAHGPELVKKFSGRIVFVDFNSKMIHYYTKEEGHLRVRVFSDAATLNNYDFVDLHSRAIGLEHDTVKQIIKVVEAAQATENADQIPGVNLQHLAVDWHRALLNDPGMSEIKAANTVTPSSFPVSIEMLRESYKSDRVLYNLVESYYNYFASDRAVDLAKGYTFIGDDDTDDLKELANRMAIPQLGVMLHAAKMNDGEFPKIEVAKAAVEKALDALENPKLDLKFPGLGRYLNEHGVAEFFKLKPHQVRGLGMADQLDKGVLDIDMGGGKTLISILLIVRRLEMLKAQGTVPRALVVMPDALITNFYREIKKFTARDPNNKAATARLNVVTLRNANIKMRYYTPREEVIEKMTSAPDNTIFISAYSYLGGPKSVVKIFTGETRQKKSGELVHKAEFMFPNVEDLLNKVGINIVFLDESHKIKNNFENGSYSHKACMALSRVKHKFIMTGTFVSRTPQDMFNQVKFIDPTMLGSIADFKRRYTLDNGRNWQHDKLKELRSYIQRRGVITMRREEWLHQLPPKIEKFHFVDFKEQTPIIYKIYETLWEDTKEKFPAEFTEALGGKINNDSDSDDTNGLEDLEATETLDDEMKEIERLQDESNKLADNMRSSTVCGRLMALRALVAAPERFPIFTEAFRTVQQKMSFNVEDLLKGPKDETVLKLVRAHFETLRGTYIPLDEQTAPANEKIGKIVIMSDRALIASHMVRILQEAGFADNEVVYYDASHKEHLEAFCDPNAKYPFIMCAVENSIKEGVNMQSASRVIRLTVPWTTGDYDQSIARAFRTGQTKPVFVDNVLATSSFEPAMVARLVTRENVNKKVTSDFDSNEYVEEITINPTTAGPNGEIVGERDLRNYTYGANGQKVDLLQLHDRIYAYEMKMSKVWKFSYLLKLVDTKEQADRDPNKFVWKGLDRRSEIKYQGNDYAHEGIPSLIIRDQNMDLEHKIVYVNAEKKNGWIYVMDERRNDLMRVIKIKFFELDNANERHEDRDIAGSNKLYEPWATAGIHEEEMAVPMSDEVTEAEMEKSAEKQLRGIGQDDPETTLRQKIVRHLRAAAEQGFDPSLSMFLDRNALSIDNKLVTAIYDAITVGTYHKIFSSSPAVSAVYSALTKVKFNPKDDEKRLQHLFKMSSAQFMAKQEAIEQGRTGKPTRVTIPAEPGPNERTLGGPVRRDKQEVEDLTKLQVALGDQNGVITLVVPANQKNPSWKKLKGIPGYKVMKGAMFFPITAEPQINGVFNRVKRSGGEVTNIDEFSTPEFKKVLRILAQPEKPDQTASLSVYNNVTAAKAVEIDLMWITMDRKLLIVAIDVTAKQHAVLSAAGFKPMQPYIWKEVTPKGISREVKRLSTRVALRNPVTLGSRVLKLLKVRLADEVLGLGE